MKTLTGANAFQLYRKTVSARLVRNLVRRHGLRLRTRILAAIAADNPIRTVLCLAAREAKLDPRQLSFSPVLYWVNAFWPDLLAKTASSHWKRELRRRVHLAARCKLPKRQPRRSYPREVWARGYRFPIRQETNSQNK